MLCGYLNMFYLMFTPTLQVKKLRSTGEVQGHISSHVWKQAQIHRVSLTLMESLSVLHVMRHTAVGCSCSTSALI